MNNLAEAFNEFEKVHKDHEKKLVQFIKSLSLTQMYLIVIFVFYLLNLFN